MKIKHGRLYGCFIDFKKAFDNVWHEGLLVKLHKIGIQGRCFEIIKNMYHNSTICTRTNEGFSDEIMVKKGVHQGNTLSPTLFNIFINDITSYLPTEDSPYIDTYSNQKLPCLLYADDLVLFSFTKNGLQRKLDQLYDYCSKWGFQINREKSKVIVFSKTEPKIPLFFKCGDDVIETTDTYKYLGIMINKNGTFTNAQEHLSKQAQKATHALNRALIKENIDINIILRLYDSLISPIATYGSEIWLPFAINHKVNFQIFDLFNVFLSNKLPHENLHTKFCRRILGVHKNTMKIPVLAELGRFPLSINIIGQIFMYWIHIITTKETSHVNRIYNLQKTNLECNGNSWVFFIKTLMHKLGLTHVWKNQHTFNKHKLKHVIINKLQHEYIRFWKNHVKSGCSKLKFYDTIVKEYQLEPYLLSTNNRKHRQAMSKLRISAHDLDVERGRYRNVPREQRLCKICNVVEDEIHFLDNCQIYTDIRQKFLSNFSMHKKPSDILTTDNKNSLKLICIYIYDCFVFRAL